MSKQTYDILDVKNIDGIERPIVVLEVPNNQKGVKNHDKGIARTPEQMLRDLKGSLLLPKDVTSTSDQRFIDALRNCRGGKVTADVRFFKAGDKYTIEAGHPALTDTNHPLYDKVKVGDTQIAESDGAWVEGFMTVEYSQITQMNQQVAKEIANSYTSMFAGASAAPVASVAAPIAEESEEELAALEASGTAA